MRGLLSFLLGNWPLKLGAVALATVLYGGVVLSQNTRTWPGQVPIDVLNPPQNAAVLDFLGYVTNIQFRAPLDVASRLTNGSFGASIDLANASAPADGSPLEVPVSLRAIDRSVEIVDYQPKVVRVTLDPVVSQTKPVTLQRGQIPEALTVGPPQVDPQSVTLTGARSRVSSVHEVTARVLIDASGLNVDQEVDLQALDQNGAQVTGVQIDPKRVHVRIDVSRNTATVQLPVRVQLTGSPAAGYQLSDLTVTPVVVAVGGEAPVVGRLGGVDTLPIDLSGRTSSFSVDVPLDVPSDVTIDAATTVHVQVNLSVAQVSRTIEAGLEIRGARSDAIYALSRPSVLVTLTGPADIVDQLTPSDVHAVLEVASLGTGTHVLTVAIEAPTGAAIESVTPSDVSIDVSSQVTPPPTATPSVGPSASPTASP